MYVKFVRAFRLRCLLLAVIPVVSILLTGCGHVTAASWVGIEVPRELPEAREVGGVDVALVLGGGGAKGLAHVGVLEVLEEEGIPINLIVGTSSGAVIGAMYASLVDAREVKARMLSLNKWDLLDLSLFETFRMCYTASGPVLGYKFEKFFFETLEHKNIEELPIPFVAVAADIETTKPVIIKSGPLAPAVHASSAIPPFFTPVELYGKKLVDGGAVYPVPTPVAKEYNPKVMIAVDISAPPEKGEMNSSVYLSYRTLHMAYYELCRMQSKLADVDIHPHLEGFGLFDDDQNEEIYQRGRAAAIRALPIIKGRLAEAGIELRK